MSRPTQIPPVRGPEEDFIEQLLRQKKPLLVDRTIQFDLSGYPSADHLAETVTFAPDDGNIWLCGQRMMLLQASSFGAIRSELAHALGAERARGLLTRTGWQAGARDAAKVNEQWPAGDHASLFSAGPRLHMLKGMLRAEVIRFEIDSGIGHFYAEFLWHNSIEDDVHIAANGIGSEAACWMQIGYASGYASSLLGRLIVFREVECRATGQQACRIIGKPAQLWEDVEADLAHFDASEFLSRSSHVAPASPAPDALAEPTADDKPMVGICASFIAATHLLQRVAPTQATVLLTGESGVGKELFARTLHQSSSRRHLPMIALNCATLPENLVEAELFGVERGAFTGADRSRPGRFERANGATLFLDEIATLSLSAQSKILRALQEGEIERVGGTTAIRVDVRVIAATNLNLLDEVAAGRFREDLFYRLNVFPIHLPPLRERREDIPLLINHFLRTFSARHGRTLGGLSTRLVNALLTHRFPGNIRELQNLIERGVIAAADGEVMDVIHLSQGGTQNMATPVGLTTEGKLSSLAATREQRDKAEADAQLLQRAYETQQPGAGPSPAQATLDKLQAFVQGRERELGASLKEIEGLLVDLALEKSAGNITAAAQMLGMSRAQISYRLKDK